MNRLDLVFKGLHFRILGLLLGCFPGLNGTALSVAQDLSATENREPQRWAVIIVGLPGDAEHAALFRKMADQIQKWLVNTQRIPVEQVFRLPETGGDGETTDTAATAESIHNLLTDVNSKLQANDTLWIFTIGHGNYDGRQAWFHVAGKDPSNDDFGQWMADIDCREQVLWLTHSSSGWFVKPLSRPGRIVIAATAADDESNETEFLRALTTVAGWSVDKLDGDHDQAISVAEFYLGVVREVARRFQYDNRLPTEHAQLDDNGDGVGTENLEVAKSGNDPAASKGVRTAKVDGDLAKTILIPYAEIEHKAEHDSNDKNP